MQNNDLQVTLSSGSLTIDIRVFWALLNLSHIKTYAAYRLALLEKSIKFSDLKFLALKADVPYPLFFSPLDKVLRQIWDFDNELNNKIPSKEELSLNSRGRLKVEDIKLILKDLSRRQGLLSKQLLPTAPVNTYVGSIAKLVKGGTSSSVLATTLRDALCINLDDFRSTTKEGGLSYLVEKAEAQGIFVSFSSHHYMPQNLKDVEMSGICLKDSKFPFIFINTKDGDDNPEIIEPAGRQIFTLLTMLVCIAMNRFVFSSKTKESKLPHMKIANEVVGEVLIPESDLSGITVRNLEDIKKVATFFKVTPSMCLVRLSQKGIISRPLANELRTQLAEEVKGKGGIPRQPLPVNAYLKYNGSRFSREVLTAEKKGIIHGDVVRNALFRKGKKMDPNLLRDYRAKLRL